MCFNWFKKKCCDGKCDHSKDEQSKQPAEPQVPAQPTGGNTTQNQ